MYNSFTKRMSCSSILNDHRIAVATTTITACLGIGWTFDNYQTSNQTQNQTQKCHCEGYTNNNNNNNNNNTNNDGNNHNNDEKKHNSNNNNNNDFFLDYFPMNQLHQPKKPYPAWDDNWDGKHGHSPASDVSDVSDASDNKHGNVTRHLILIRHGQYDETFEDDTKRKLTELGRQQAHLTGQRLAEMIQGMTGMTKTPTTKTTKTNDNINVNVNINSIRVSDMTRAKETASIISEYLPKHVVINDNNNNNNSANDNDNNNDNANDTIHIQRHEPDPLLNEGIPAQIIPKRPELNIDDDLAKNGARIEKAFTKYFYRKKRKKKITTNKKKQQQQQKEDETQTQTQTHEFDIIVCHGNVIRYFFCRALQLPPEAWLRLSIFNCSLTYLMIKPNGRVNCRLLGDIGHLSYDHSTFSMNHGFAW